MREGCLIGCLGLIVVAMILAIVIVATLEFFFGVFREADRVSLTDLYGDDHAVTILVEPDAAFVTGVSEAAYEGSAWMVEWVMPHEGIVFANVDRGTAEVTVSTAVSMRRMAGFLSYNLPDPDGLKLFGDMPVTDIGVQSNGVAYAHSKGEIDADLIARSASMVSVSADVPYEMEGGHLVEVLLNNTGGNAFVALEALSTGPSSGDTSPPPITEEQQVELGKNIQSGRLVFDAIDADSVSLDVDFHLVDPSMAEEIIPLLEDMLEYSAEHSNEGQMTTTVTGSLEPTDYGLKGSFVLDSIREPLADRWKRTIDELEEIQQR